ncbi:MAG: glycoside hydrolase family 88 protein [Candidatus Symbiothrix sp.]|jgi:GH18 family chitinase|nr:glycoside hydrolase family 88 protein [Candidatus Symbiothrix sp.]
MFRKIFLSLCLLPVGIFAQTGANEAIRFAVRQMDYSLLYADSVLQQNPSLGWVEPCSVNRDGSLRMIGMRDWCAGFYPGSLWYLYELTGDEKYAQAADRYCRRIENEQFDTSSHDIGFKLNCSFGNGFRLTQNAEYQAVLIQAAKTLTKRFNPVTGSIRSWDWNRETWQFPVIVDNMMNLELLFSATLLTGDSIYHHIADIHAMTTLKNHYRNDYSSYHVVDYNPENGKVNRKQTFQGYADESAWARGQAWGLYGFTMAYRYTANSLYLQQAKGIADFILHHPNLPDDGVPYWDFNDPAIPNAPRDVSAACIVMSALYELSQYLPEMHEYYLEKANQWMDNIIRDYRSPEKANYGFLLLHSTGNHPSGDEIDVPINYADYYFLEALARKLKIETKTGHRSIGYIPNWAYSCYTTLDYSALTHLNIAFCNPNTAGDLSAGLNDNTLNAIIKKAHDKGVKVMASLGGAGYSSNYPALIQEDKRAMFCEKIINYAKKYAFDGIDLDVEGEAAESFWGAAYEAWVAELRTRCTAENLLLTTAVGQWYADKITNKTFTYFDFVTIMEYDLKANNYQGRINYFLNKGIPKDELVLGLPFYGYKNGQYAAYKDILAENPDAWKVSSINNCTYHNMQDIADIAVLSKNYGGVMIWELSQDAQGRFSLLNALREALYGNGFTMPVADVPVTGVTMPVSKIEVKVGSAARISSTVTPANASTKSVMWSVDDPELVSIDLRGFVYGLKEGTTLLTATTVDGNFTAKARLTVVNANVSIDEISDNTAIKTYYYPEEKQIVIASESIVYGNYELYTVAGISQKKGRLAGKAINVSDLEQGLYIFALHSADRNPVCFKIKIE